MENKELATLFANFNKATWFSSNTESGLQTTEGKQIVALGVEAVRYIFEHRVPLGPHVLSLLSTLTNENPCNPKHAGHIDLLASDWREWARVKGYL